MVLQGPVQASAASQPLAIGLLRPVHFPPPTPPPKMPLPHSPADRVERSQARIARILKDSPGRLALKKLPKAIASTRWGEDKAHAPVPDHAPYRPDAPASTSSLGLGLEPAWTPASSYSHSHSHSQIAFHGPWISSARTAHTRQHPEESECSPRSTACSTFGPRQARADGSWMSVESSPSLSEPPSPSPSLGGLLGDFPVPGSTPPRWSLAGGAADTVKGGLRPLALPSGLRQSSAAAEDEEMVETIKGDASDSPSSASTTVVPGTPAADGAARPQLQRRQSLPLDTLSRPRSNSENVLDSRKVCSRT